MLVSIYLVMQKHSCIKLDLERGALINPSMMEVGHSGAVPGELVTSEEVSPKGSKGWKGSLWEESYWPESCLQERKGLEWASLLVRGGRPSMPRAWSLCHGSLTPWRNQGQRQAGREIITGMKANSECQGCDASRGCREGWKEAT